MVGVWLTVIDYKWHSVFIDLEYCDNNMCSAGYLQIISRTKSIVLSSKVFSWYSYSKSDLDTHWSTTDCSEIMYVSNCGGGSSRSPSPRGCCWPWTSLPVSSLYGKKNWIVDSCFSFYEDIGFMDIKALFITKHSWIQKLLLRTVWLTLTAWFVLFLSLPGCCKRKLNHLLFNHLSAQLTPLSPVEPQFEGVLFYQPWQFLGSYKSRWCGQKQMYTNGHKHTVYFQLRDIICLFASQTALL